ncbi:hypothetical protein FJY63_06415 [Candidatus Sumerlaeota bacterium]|nr:hypothetical protein [Candidatus Sumerlaeota bacterium]
MASSTPQSEQIKAVFAAADLGSNATKVLIWQIGGDNHPREISQRRFPMRLSDAFRTGKIEPPTVAALTEVFAEIADLCRKHGAATLKAVATDAFRQASNSRQVTDAIALETGIEIEVVSAQREAELVAKGVLLDHPVFADDLLVLDVGGGSAQISVFDRRDITVTSVPLGAVRLREMFVRCDQIAPLDYQAMCSHVDRVVAEGLSQAHASRTSPAIGCGGGVRFIHAMCAVHGGVTGQNEPVRLNRLEHLCEAIWHMPVDSIVRLYGIDRERAEIIVPGAVVLLALMKHLRIGAVIASRRGVRDGLLSEFLDELAPPA